MTRNLKVLYVEDEPDIRAVTQFALEDEGFELCPCSSGAEALRRAPEGPWDLILLDVMMPGMDGPTTLQQLRAVPGLQETPVLFMTAKVQPAELAEYLALGARGIISKPFDPLTLGDQIRQQIGET